MPLHFPQSGILKPFSHTGSVSMQAYRQKAEPQETFYCELPVLWSTWFTLNYQMVPLYTKSLRSVKTSCPETFPDASEKKRNIVPYLENAVTSPVQTEKKLCEETEHTLWVNSAFCRQEPFIWRKGEVTSSEVAWSRMEGTKGTFRTQTLFLTLPMTCCEFGSPLYLCVPRLLAIKQLY